MFEGEEKMLLKLPAEFEGLAVNESKLLDTLNQYTARIIAEHTYKLLHKPLYNVEIGNSKSEYSTYKTFDNDTEAYSCYNSINLNNLNKNFRKRLTKDGTLLQREVKWW